MKIRTRVIFNTVLFGILLLAVSVSVMVTELRAQATHQQEVIATTVEREAYELGYLANDYLLYRESQQASRWQSKFVSFSANLASLRVSTPQQQTLANNIKVNQQRLKAVFDEVSGFLESTAQTRGPADDPAFMQVSWSRMEVQSQGIIFDASRLTGILREQEDQLRRVTGILNFVLIGLVGVFLVTNLMLTYQRILKALAVLQAGTRIIGSGNLDHRIEEHRKDEIGELAGAFNQMTRDLRAVTASKADLEQEIAERERAESQREAALEALTRAHDELESRVRELGTLLEVSHALASTLKTETLMGLMLEHLNSVTPFTDATVYSLENREIVRLAFRGPDLPALPDALARIPLAQAPVHARVASGELVSVPDVWEDTLDARAVRETRIPLLQAQLADLHSWLGIPLCCQDRVIGVLVLHHSQAGFYDSHRVGLARAFADQAALAMDNARLYEQAKELAVLEERQRLARDLHDAVSQTLFAASTIADVLPRIWERDPEQARRRLQELCRLNRGAFAEMRMLLLELRPNILVQTALPDLIEQLGSSAGGRSQLQMTVNLDGNVSLPPDVHVAFYRIAQEALNNIVKHAKAKQAALELRCMQGKSEKAGSAELIVRDDGCGFDTQGTSGQHMGLRIMRERAEAIGARLDVESRAGHGTRVRVVWQERVMG